MKFLLSFILVVLAWGCSHHSSVDKHLNHSGNVMDVKELVTEIVIDTPLLSGMTTPYILGKYLILSDHQSKENLVFIFDKKDFSYIAGAVHPGEGPDEITMLGELIPDKVHHRLFVADYGKMKIMSYSLDSILLNPDCLPESKIDMNNSIIPTRLIYVNDTLCYACCMTVESGKPFQESLVTWNMKTGDIHPLISGHPEIERKRIRYTVSLEKKLIAVSYNHHDLLATYDLKGNLKHYIYGSNWDNATSNAMIYYYKGIIICNDRIIVGYSGESNPNTGPINVTHLLMYDLDGNYIKTLNVGYNMNAFCYDPEYNRIIMSLNDENRQFAYLDLDGLLELE